MLNLDITMLFQLVNFFIVLYVLNILLIRPIRGILKERRDKMDNLSGEADAFEREATARLASYNESLQRARQEAGQTRDAARTEAQAEQQRIVQEAGQKAQALLTEAKASIKAESDATLAELRARVQDLGARLAARVMG